MKKQLLLVLLCITSMSAISQTWVGLGANTNWNNIDNWDNNLVPTASDDVIIPTGFTVTLNVPGTVKSIDVQGNSTFVMNTNFTFTEPSTFGSNTTINWTAGTISGGTTLSNNGTLNTLNNNIILNGATTLSNNGIINFQGSGDILIAANSILNNSSTGTIDFQADNSGISETGAGINLLNNFGLIKTSFVTADPTDQATINLELKNNGGTIQVEVGILNLSNGILDAMELTDGTYNVFAGANLDWDNAVTISGTLTGDVQGNINWRSTVRVNSPTTATFDFTGNETVTWISGSLDGGGTLTNENKIAVQGSNVSVIGITTLTNNGEINFEGVGDILIQSDSILNNSLTGTIDFQTDNSGISETGAGINLLNNFGLIKTSFITADPTDQATINLELKNNGGTIQVEVGTLNLSNGIADAIELKDGTYNVFTGANLDWDSSITVLGTLTGNIIGSINWRSIVRVNSPNIATFNFTGNETLVWVSGSLSGGGTLVNENKIMVQGSNVSVIGTTTLTNNGEINFEGIGDILIQNDSVLNNSLTGIIDFQTDNSGISESGSGINLLNNFGLIKTSFITADLTDQATINLELKNNDGTIQVEVGTLNLSNGVVDAMELTDGTYNVFAGANLDWDNAVTISGTLTGDVQGNINWRSTVRVNSPGTTTFDFTGNETVTWISGSLDGGGTLVNENKIAVQGSNVFINGITTLTNNGAINFEDGGDIFIQNDSVLNNSLAGTIDFQGNNSGISQTGAGINLLNNAGLLICSSSTSSVINVEVINTGTIEAAFGTLNFSGTLDHQAGGIVKGIANFNMPTVANFTNNGTFAPGTSPGTLTVIGNYVSTPSTILDVELGGLIPDTEHDVLEITGTNVVFEGFVDVTMGFEGTVGDEFTVATTSGTIATANLQSPIENVDFDGKRYTFDVSYADDNKVELTITDKLDILPPDIITQDITVQLDSNGEVSIIPTDVDDGTTDNCTPTNELVFELDVMDFTCADLGDNTVTLTVTDNDGNSDNASVTVTVEDSIDPVVTCPADIVQSNDSGTCGAVVNFMASATDNCPGVSTSSVPASGSVFAVGTTEVTVTATDASGNTDVCTFDVTVNDTENPVVTCPADIVQSNDSGTCGAVVNFMASATDNCPGVSTSSVPASGSVFAVGTTEVTVTATDASGNTDVCTFDVTVNDTENPVVTCPADIVQSNDSGTCGAVVNFMASATDNCPGVSTSSVPASGSVFAVGTTEVTVTATDASGNTDVCTFDVTVNDTENPVVTCPTDIVQSNDSGTCGAVVNFMASATDNCPGVSTSSVPASGSVFAVGTTEVTVTATDASGNADVCTFDVTVNDTENPIVTCPADFTVLSAGDYELPDYFLDNTVIFSDNCGVVSMTQTPNAGTELSLGEHTITFLVNDALGNSDSCSFQLTIFPTLSVDSYKLLEDEISVYPNPVVNSFTLKNKSKLQLVNVEIIDITGKILQKVNLTTMISTKEISLGNYASGMYFIKVNAENNTSITKRVMKQ